MHSMKLNPSVIEVPGRHVSERYRTDGMTRAVSECSIGLDLGGTNLPQPPFDRSGKTLDKTWGGTRYSEGPETIVSDIAEAIQSLRDRFGKQRLAGIAIGVPGFVSPHDGVIFDTPHS
jgi:predicted NBD/HSP70 family sugar kinase